MFGVSPHSGIYGGKPFCRRKCHIEILEERVNDLLYLNVELREENDNKQAFAAAALEITKHRGMKRCLEKLEETTGKLGKTTHELERARMQLEDNQGEKDRGR